MAQLISQILAIVALIMQEVFKRRDEKKKRIDHAINETKAAFAEPDKTVRASRLNSVINKLRS